MKRVMELIDLLLSGVIALSSFYGLYYTGVFGLFDLEKVSKNSSHLTACVITIVLFMRFEKIVAVQKKWRLWAKDKMKLEHEPD